MKWLLAILGLAIVVAMLWPSPPGESGSFPVLIEGPEGEIWNGTVDAQDATVATALLAAGDAGGFQIEATGRGASFFVVAIDGFANSGDGGWCVAILDETWRYLGQSAANVALVDGQPTRWEYRADGCPQ